MSVDAAPSRPILKQTDWRTGELEIHVTDISSDTDTISLYVAKWDDPDNYVILDAWATYGAAELNEITKYFENGQSYWYYVRAYDIETDTWSDRSNVLKQTPPITAYIINWPDMFQDLVNAINDANKKLTDHIDDLLTPSDQAMKDLQDAIDGMKDAVGAGSANSAGNQLQNGLDGVQSGMQLPIGVDDGNGTFTGGSSGSNLPYPNQNVPIPGGNGSPGMNLEFPNADSGTDNELTMRIPYMVDMQGNLVYLKIFTDEQMEKMKWLNLIRGIAGAVIFIMFGMWLVSRFSPQLKS